MANANMEAQALEADTPNANIEARAREAERERNEQLRHLEKEMFQLANYYFVFQGVIFTSFYRGPPHVKCGYVWVPMTLSIMAGILNLVALLRILLNYHSLLDDVYTGVARNCITAKFERRWRRFYIGSCMALVLAFLVVTLVGCHVVMCDSANSSVLAPHGG